MSEILTKGVDLAWEERSGERFLKFTFNGNFNEEIATNAVEAWKAVFREQLRPNEKVTIVWDCLNMTNYESGARKAWQSTMSELNDKIKVIWVITTNPVIRMAAKTMSLLTKYNLKAVNSELDIN